MLAPERTVWPLTTLFNKELLETICDKHLEEASVREVEDEGRLSALRKRAAVDAPLPNLTEFMDTVQAKTVMGSGGQIGDRVCKVKANIGACLKNYAWRKKVCPGGEWVGDTGR